MHQDAPKPPAPPSEPELGSDAQSPTTKWRVPRALLLAVTLLLAFEFGAAREDWFWGWVRYSQIGVIDALETQVLADAHPQILFTGSSRVRDAVAPRVLEKKLGLAEGSVLNLGLTMGTPFDAGILYKRNREQLKQAKLVFFGVEPFQLDRYNAPTERVLRYGTLRDRMALLGRKDRLHHRIGFFWRTLDTGPALRRFLKTALVPPPQDPPIASDGRIIWRTDDDNARARKRPARIDAERFFSHWRPSDNRGRQLTTLLDMFAEDGMTVVVFQIPSRDRFWDYVHDKYPDKAKEYGKRVREAATGHDVYMFWNGSDHGLRPQHFYDYGHLKHRPARAFTRKMAKLIKKAYPKILAAARADAPAPRPAPRAHASPRRKGRPKSKQKRLSPARPSSN